MSATMLHGDCRTHLAALAPASVDAIVTDPPYGLAFMGAGWDHAVPGVDYWREALRVAKPGAHLVAFGGTRTFHRLACAIEDAGWEVRDVLSWLYGSGFPKSLDVSKAIDKAAGAERTERLGPKAGHENFVGRDNMKALRESGALSGEGGFSRPWMHDPEKVEAAHWDYAPATDAAREWAGWGTALKPAWEPIILARKPLAGTVAATVQAHGTGALNVDGCRIPGEPWKAHRATGLGSVKFFTEGECAVIDKAPHDGGRWPANVVLDEDAAAALDAMAPKAGAAAPASGPTLTGETGGASRFFYCAKASRRERNAGGVTNGHPTVKPVALMRWLVRLVTPPGGLVVDPFAGSGTTGVAAACEGVRFLGIEQDLDFAVLAERRIVAAVAAARAAADADAPLFRFTREVA